MIRTHQAGALREQDAGATVVLAGLMPSYLTFALLAPVTGLTALTFITSANTYMQLHTDAGVRLVATPPAGQPVRPHTLQVGLVDEAGALTVLDPVTVGSEPSPDVPVAGPAVLVTPDATDVAWAKLRFGPDGWERVAAALPVLQDETASVGDVGDAAVQVTRALVQVIAAGEDA